MCLVSPVHVFARVVVVVVMVLSIFPEHADLGGDGGVL